MMDGASSLADAGQVPSIDAMRWRALGPSAVSLQGGTFCFQRDARCRAFIFLDEALQLRRKFRIGCANRKAFEEKCAIAQLLASDLLE
jgi:hypothetical protein